MITYDHHDTHPVCDETSPWAAEIRAQAAAEQLAARHRGQRNATHTALDDHATALNIVRAIALRQAVLSANDLRSVPGWEHLHDPVRGAAITTAIRRGWLEPIGLEPPPLRHHPRPPHRPLPQPAPPRERTTPVTNTPDQPSTGHVADPRHSARTPAKKPANGPAKLSRRYPGRDRLDAAVSQLRRSFANLAREAAVAGDEIVARRLDELLDQVVVDLKRTTAAADAALLASDRSQADVRRELDKLRTAMNRTPAGRARTLYVRQVELLEGMLVDPDAAS